jgi:hypothetical protein
MAGSYQPNCDRASGAPGERPQALAVRRFALLAGLALATAPATGCITLDALCPAEKPPVGIACNLATRWEPGLRQAFDPCREGAAYNALAGRLYLFDAQGTHFITGDGDVIVDLFDDRPLLAGHTPVALERWQFPSKVLQLLCAKDAYGWGYTLALPWIQSYRPDITQVHLRVCYVPAGGAPMYKESSTIKLAQENLVLPQGLAQPKGWQAPPPNPIQPPAALRLERKPLAVTNPYPAAPLAPPVQVPTTAAPVQAPTTAAPVQAPTPAEAPALDAFSDCKPIVLTPRRMPPQTVAPAPAQAVNQAGGLPTANISFDAGAQRPAQPITQAAGQVPAETPGAAAQPAWVGTAK